MTRTTPCLLFLSWFLCLWASLALGSALPHYNGNNDNDAALPTPTKTTPALFVPSSASPTQKPVLVRRNNQEVQATLSLYMDWAAACNNDDDSADAQVNLASVDPKLKQLWQTVTQTVYCGNGHVKTRTKTVTATATATETSSSGDDNGDDGVKCDDQCWSDYLWHTYGYGISVAQGFVGIVCILIGLYFMLFGYRFFRPTLAMTGFVFFTFMTWVGLVNNEPIQGYPHEEIVYICVSIGLGLLGAIIFMLFFYLSIYFIGSLGGIWLATYIMSWRENLVIQLKVARVCFIVALGVVMAILVFLLESYIIIFATSFTGAYLFMLGLDFFVHTGFINAILLIYDGNSNHYNAYIMNRPVYIMLAFVAVLCVISFIWQYYWNVYKNQRYFGINVVHEPPAGEGGEGKA